MLHKIVCLSICVLVLAQCHPRARARGRKGRRRETDVGADIVDDSPESDVRKGINNLAERLHAGLGLIEARLKEGLKEEIRDTLREILLEWAGAFGHTTATPPLPSSPLTSVGTAAASSASVAASTPSPDAGRTLRQWVSAVDDFSSQYSRGRYSSNQIVGEPDVYPKYGDEPQAWAPLASSCSGDWVEIILETPVYVTRVEIYETYNPGGTKEILALNPDGTRQVLWATPRVRKAKKKSRIFSPPLKRSKQLVNTLRITIDCSEAGSWVELDAVRITGVTQVQS